MRSVVALALLASCAGSSDDEDDGRTDDINETTLIEGVSAYCDGEASALDWLIVFEVDTTTNVADVEAEVVQSGQVYGPVDLNEVRPGEWYGEIWEDDLGMDCEGANFGLTVYATDNDGNTETFDL